MTSAAVAVALAWRRAGRPAAGRFGLVTLVFGCTLVANVVERPDGVEIASCFFAASVLVSMLSRVWRTPPAGGSSPGRATAPST